MLRSHTKSFLCCGGCLVCCPESVVSLVPPDGAPPAGGFCTAGPMYGSRSGGGSLGAGGLVGSLPEVEVAFSAPPRLLVVPWTRLRPGRQPPPAKVLLHFASAVPLAQGDGHACWPGRLRTISLCAVPRAPCRASTTGAVFWAPA